MDKKQQFEVILAPIDMLEQELEGVLGGGCTSNDCGTNGVTCSGNTCKTNNGTCGSNICTYNLGQCKDNTCSQNGPCDPGYIWDGCKCVPAEW